MTTVALAHRSVIRRSKSARRGSAPDGTDATGPQTALAEVLAIATSLGELPFPEMLTEA